MSASRNASRIRGNDNSKDSVQHSSDDDEDDDPDFETKSGSGSESSESSSESSDEGDDAKKGNSSPDDSDASDTKDDLDAKRTGHSPIGLAFSDPFANHCQVSEAAGYVVYSSTVASNSANEDRILVDHSGLFCVFDGHGGSECSSFATEKFSAAFYKNYSKKETKPIDDLESLFFSTGGKETRETGSGRSDDGDDARRALKKSFLAIDSEFLDTHGKKSPTTGSCGLVCFLEAGAVWSAVVGDSRSTCSNFTSFSYFTWYFTSC
jgi:hypothetical protein